MQRCLRTQPRHTMSDPPKFRSPSALLDTANNFSDGGMVAMDTYRLTVLQFGAVMSSQSAYNSQAHTASEIDSALSRSSIRLPSEIIHAWPPPEPYAYVRYADLVANSQHSPPDKRLNLVMPGFVARELLTLQASFLAKNDVSDTRVAEVSEDWQDSRACRSVFHAAFSLGEKWFVRLDDASPKDSPTKMPVTSAKQLVRMLATSMRARAEVELKLQEGSEIIVFLRPWDEQMRKGIEFRCFIPPLAVHAAKSQERAEAAQVGWTLSAMSQYTWHQPFPTTSTTKFSAPEIIQTALDGAKRCMADVIDTAGEVGTLGELEKWGFILDIVVKLQGFEREVQLVEINPFGAVSGCGSCLFHWLRDAEQLYGLKNDIEVRTATDE